MSKTTTAIQEDATAEVCTEHFDFIIDEYSRNIKELKSRKKTPEIKQKLNSLYTQKIAIEIAKESYLDDFS